MSPQTYVSCCTEAGRQEVCRETIIYFHRINLRSVSPPISLTLMLRFPLNSKVRFHFLKIHTYLVLFHDVSKTYKLTIWAICVEKTNSCKTYNFRTFLYDKTDAKYSILKFWWSTTVILPSYEFLVSRRDLVIGKFKSSFFSTEDKLSPESGKRKILFSCQ